MTYEEVFNEAKEKFKDDVVSNYRPATPLHTGLCYIPNAIIIWFKDGSKTIYYPKEKQIE